MSEPDARQQGFRKAFNTHGFGLQYSVTAEISRFRSHTGGTLELVGTEVPVSVGGKETHADFVFRDSRIGGYLVGECKKTSTVFSEWCFAATGLTRSLSNRQPVLDQLHYPNGFTAEPHLRVCEVLGPSVIYEVGLAVKHPDKSSVKHPDKSGDGCGSDRDAIPTAVAQVLRAVNGFMMRCKHNERLVAKARDESGCILLLPAVFTTASLYVLDRPLHTADRLTGELPTDTRFSAVPWLWYEHNLSDSLRAELPGRYVVENWHNWADYIRHTARRAVAIVNTEHITAFLQEIDSLTA